MDTNSTNTILANPMAQAERRADELMRLQTQRKAEEQAKALNVAATETARRKQMLATIIQARRLRVERARRVWTRRGLAGLGGFILGLLLKSFIRKQRQVARNTRHSESISLGSSLQKALQEIKDRRERSEVAPLPVYLTRRRSGAHRHHQRLRRLERRRQLAYSRED